MKVLVFVLAALTATEAAKHVSLNDFGYYWRDWNVDDPIPKDAVSGGVVKGEKSFITRNIYPSVGQMVVGRVVPSEKASYFEHGYKHVKSVEDVQVLCAINHKRLKWINATDNQNVEEVVGNNVMIIGGHDKSRPLMVGKTVDTDGDILIGKVVVDGGKFYTMRISKADDVTSTLTQYQVLIYGKNCEDGSVSLNIDED